LQVVFAHGLGLLERALDWLSVALSPTRRPQTR
jgi:hypothetical protein